MFEQPGREPKRQPIVAVLIQDPAVRDSFRFLLETSGYRAETYVSANDYLGKLEESAATCLLLEQELADMSGLDLVGFLSDIGRSIRALLVAEHLTHSLLNLSSRLELVHVAKKPLEPELLMRFLQNRDLAAS